jgi:hypothetical protein
MIDHPTDPHAHVTEHRRHALRFLPGDPDEGDVITVRRPTTRQQIETFRDQLTIADRLEVVELDQEGNVIEHADPT